jgi:hypothetical protein
MRDKYLSRTIFIIKKTRLPQDVSEDTCPTGAIYAYDRERNNHYDWYSMDDFFLKVEVMP